MLCKKKKGYYRPIYYLPQKSSISRAIVGSAEIIMANVGWLTAGVAVTIEEVFIKNYFRPHKYCTNQITITIVSLYHKCTPPAEH